MRWSIMIKFLKLPVRLTTNQEVKDAEISGKEEDWFEGFALVNISEIEYICAGEETCSIYFKSGSWIECTTEIDVLEAILEKHIFE